MDFAVLRRVLFLLREVDPDGALHTLHLDDRHPCGPWLRGRSNVSSSGTTNGGASAGRAGAGFSGTTGSATSGDGMCKIVQPSNYDQSCTVDTDCVLVGAGTTSCSPDCRCLGMATVNARAQAQYDKDLKQALALAGHDVVACGCLRPPPPATIAHCHGATCQLDPLMPTPPSCHLGGPGQSDCRPAKESCCTRLAVTGGTYYRTYTSDVGWGGIGLADPATVSSFRLAK